MTFSCMPSSNANNSRAFFLIPLPTTTKQQSTFFTAAASAYKISPRFFSGSSLPTNNKTGLSGILYFRLTSSVFPGGLKFFKSTPLEIERTSTRSLGRIKSAALSLGVVTSSSWLYTAEKFFHNKTDHFFFHFSERIREVRFSGIK